MRATRANADAARAADLLTGARRLVVFTGAGMSQESGVPTFRDAQSGLWASFNPAELATPEAFRRNPARVFGWYLWRARLVRTVEPHTGYAALVQLSAGFESYVVVTQNVDGLHQRAGSSDVIELHGRLDAFRCFDRDHPFDASRLAALESLPEGDVDPPLCPECGSPIRPGVVWFGEMLPPDDVARANDAVTQCDALLVVGTSGLVYPAAELPWLALERGATLIEVNPTPTPFSRRAHVSWRSTAATALPLLVQVLGQRANPPSAIRNPQLQR